MSISRAVVKSQVSTTPCDTCEHLLLAARVPFGYYARSADSRTVAAYASDHYNLQYVLINIDVYHTVYLGQDTTKGE